MNKLIVLDYSVPVVHIYDVDSNANIDENYISNLGFQTSNCNWMLGNGGMDIFFHNEILK